ncbi:helix-turn-helix transcriptional regulator [Novosphingobium sp. JCM 18896]|nr:helix-turn-helix transcriptional regulator [Novosphingobium sp. JCM 18896]
MNGFLYKTDHFGREHRRKLERIELMNPGDDYRMLLPPWQVRAMYCSIDRNEFEGLLDQPLAGGADDWQAHIRPRMSVIGLLLNRIYEELRDQNFASAAALEAYASALRIELVRCLRASQSAQSTIRKGGLAPWRQRLLHERISADAPAPRLPELADICGMTVRQLSRAYKEETGKTLGCKIIEVTIERAVRMLIESDLPIADISAELGFSSPASFTYAFRRSAGVQPREFRKRAAS